MRLNHNMFSLSIRKSYGRQLTDNAKALNNISTGTKLNSAKDNPAKIGRNETLKIQILSNDAANRNIQDTASMIQTFDGALQEMNNSLCRMKELTVKGANGTLTEEDKKIVQKEIDSIKANIDELANNTEFNGVKLSDSNLTGDQMSTIKAVIGTMDDENMDIPFFNVSAKNLGVADIDMNNGNVANETVDNAIEMLSKVRSKYGSLQKRLEGTGEYLGEKNISVQRSQSNIGDADIAKEMVDFSKSQLLIQSSIGLLAQSNNFPQDALKVLENIR